jgi:hypothetical protein
MLGKPLTVGILWAITEKGGVNMEYNAKLYTQNESKINGRGVWHYLIDTPIGQIHVVEYENPQKELIRFLIDSNLEKATAKYNAICKNIIAGKI